MTKEHQDILNELIEMSARGDLDKARFDNLPIQVYHHPNCPGLSATAVKIIKDRSIAHYEVLRSRRNQRLDFGSAFHMFVNEPEVFREEVHVIQPTANGATNWKAAQQAASGKMLISDRDFRALTVMSKKLFTHPETSDVLRSASFESSFFWRDSETGVLFKCRLDIFSGFSIWDLKTCENAAAEAFADHARRMRYRIQSAMQLDGAALVLDMSLNDFRLIACEYDEPFEIKPHRVSQESISVGRREYKEVGYRMAEFRESGGTGWAGYPLGYSEISI